MGRGRKTNRSVGGTEVEDDEDEVVCEWDEGGSDQVVAV